MSDFKSAPLSLSIDTASKNINTNIYFYTQDFGTARFEFSIFKDTRPLDLTGARASLTLIMADKSAFQVDASVDDTLNGKISYVLPQDIIQHFGTATAELNIYFEGNTKGLSVGQFNFTINRSLADQDNPPAQEFFIESLEAIKQSYIDAFQDVENAIYAETVNARMGYAQLMDRLNLENNIKGTSQTVTKNVNGDVTKIQHKDSFNVLIREDVFDYSVTNVITETRTLISSGATLTFKYHTDTLATEVI